jgi:uncharacterized protein (DUF983 family)
MEAAKNAKPSVIWSVFAMKCPRCRKGDMFCNSSAYGKLSLNHILEMPERCNVCNQKFEMEPGFWYGTSYVSYAITVAISVASFIAWWVIIGFSIYDKRIFYWLFFNALLLIIIQPWLMRLARVLYIRFFVSYDEDYLQNKPKKFG